MGDEHQTIESQARWGRVAHRKNLLRILGGVIVGMLLAGLAAILVLQTMILTKTAAGTDRLVDCTTPGGKCYEQGRSATSGAIGTINKATVAAIYCSGKLGPKATVIQLNSCVLALVN